MGSCYKEFSGAPGVNMVLCQTNLKAFLFRLIDHSDYGFMEMGERKG